MADLGVNVRPGVIVTVGSALAVNVDGAVYTSPWWPASYAPLAGDVVRVLLCAGDASILGPTIPGQRAATGTVAGAASGGLLPVTISGATVQCRYLGTPPSPGTLVLLSWESTIPWVIAAAAAYTPPSTAPSPSTGPTAPPPTTSGTLTLSASDSGSYAYSSWSHRDVRQGSYAGMAYQGAWFYGAAPAQLAGATVTGFRVRLGAREDIGSWSAAVTLNLQQVTQGSKPSGAPTYTGTVTGVSVAPHAGAQWVSLPASVGQALVNAGGGGMGISAGTYGGVVGIDTDPASGQIALDWTR